MSYCLSNQHFPQLLKQITYPPKQLYYQGKIDLLDQPSLAVVGSRALTSYGEKACSYLVHDLVKAGLVIVSGLATGIDTVAHRAALNYGGKTIAVLGTGLNQNVIFPKQHQKLVQQIINNGGLIITEYEDTVQAEKWHFPARNRIMAGLCLGVIVIEASIKSGALLTAKYALEANREVFAVPGSIFSTRSNGTNELIKRGARLVTSAADIFSELIEILPKSFTTPKISTNLALKNIIQPLQKTLITQLCAQPDSAENLAKKLKISAFQLMPHLTELEIKGIVRKNREQNYEISNC